MSQSKEVYNVMRCDRMRESKMLIVARKVAHTKKITVIKKVSKM